MFLSGKLESGYRETPPLSDLNKKGGGVYFERFECFNLLGVSSKRTRLHKIQYTPYIILIDSSAKYAPFNKIEFQGFPYVANVFIVVIYVQLKIEKSY